MRSILIALLVLVIVSAAGAYDFGTRQVEKVPREWPVNVPVEGRQGGDTVLDAVLVTDVPFEDVGTTTGFNDDYDEVCPYSGSTAPDVVYAISFDRDRTIDIDMFGSSYDTKIYLYDENLELVACNDDYYSDYTSRLVGVPIATGVTYYLIIDGYGAEHGEYALSIPTPQPPCVVLPGCGATLENEPPLVDGYVDEHNGGCNSEEFGAPFSVVPDAGIGFTSEFAGTSGWYVTDGTNYRDTDWLRTTMPFTGYMEVTIVAEKPVNLFHLTPTDCASVGVEDAVLVQPCMEGSMTIQGSAHEEIWLWVGPPAATPPQGDDGSEFAYRVGVGGGLAGSCLEMGPQSDYSFGCDVVVVPAYETSFDAGAFTNDFDFGGLCNSSYPTPGGDVMVSVYLGADAGVSFAWHPYYIEPQPTDRYVTCMALFDDLRPATKNCVDYTCVSGLNQYSGVSATEAGWYWFVIDVGVEGDANEWGDLWFQGLAAPPEPPANNSCEGAIPLPFGDFAFQDDLTDASNSFDPGRDGCPDAPQTIFTSRDVVYEVALDHGQTLDAVMSGMANWDAALYLVRDCEDPMSNCVAAGEYEGGDLHLRYTALDDEMLWLVCDSYGPGPRPFTLTGSISVVTDAPPVAPAQLAVHAAPNPFNPATQITFDLPRAGHATLRVYALDGRLVRALVDDDLTAGRHEANWGGRDRHGRAVASGAYILRLDAGGETTSTRLLLLK